MYRSHEIKRITNRANEYLKTNTIPFTHLAAMGGSGLVLSGALVQKSNLKLGIIHVRKKGEKSSYNSDSVTGDISHDAKYLIYDDCIETGRTVEFIYAKIKKYSKKYESEIQCVGILLYTQGFYTDTYKFKDNTVVPLYAIHL